jgi:acyl-CoA hydrolase
MEERDRRRIRKRLLTRQSKILERVVDELTYYKLSEIEKTIDEIIELAKSGYIVITKTKDGLKYSVKNAELQKEAEAEST